VGGDEDIPPNHWEQRLENPLANLSNCPPTFLRDDCLDEEE